MSQTEKPALDIHRIARDHAAADKACGREWVCACATCRTVRGEVVLSPRPIGGAIAKLLESDLPREVLAVHLQALFEIRQTALLEALKDLLLEPDNPNIQGRARAVIQRATGEGK